MLYVLTLHVNFLKKYMNMILLLVQNWGKMVRLPQQQGPLLEILCIPLLSVMTLHYHRLYQISNLEANFSSEDMK